MFRSNILRTGGSPPCGTPTNPTIDPGRAIANAVAIVAGAVRLVPIDGVVVGLGQLADVLPAGGSRGVSLAVRGVGIGHRYEGCETTLNVAERASGERTEFTMVAAYRSYFAR